MSLNDCVEEITKAAGRKLSDDELDDLVAGLQDRIRERRQLSRLESYDDAVLSAADDFAQDMVAQAKIEKRNAAINLKTELEVIDFVRTQFPDDHIAGVEAWMVGVNKLRKGSRNSAAAHQRRLADQYLSGLSGDITKTGYWDEFISGVHDRDVARALWNLHQEVPDMTGIPKPAQKIARAIHKWQEVARTRANDAGAWIKKLPGWIVRQTHDQHRIQKAGFDAWYKSILPKLDAARTFGGADPEKFLRQTYKNLSTGIHLRATSDPTPFTGPRNIAKRASQHRVLHFKTADDWFDYNAEFGLGSMREGVFRGLEISAQNTGLMQVMGTNPESMLKRVVENLVSDQTEQSVKLEQASRGMLANRLKTIDGTTRTPVSAMAAELAGNARIIQRMAKLGGSFLSQFGDIPIYASEVRYQGGSMLSGIGEAMTNLGKGLGEGEYRELMTMVGAYSDANLAAGRISLGDDNGPGIISRMQRHFFKWNLMTPWAERGRWGALKSISARFAINADRAFNQLGDDFRNTLTLFGIDEPEWNIIRASEQVVVEGIGHIVPENVLNVSDEAFRDVLRGQGIKPTANRIRKLKQEISDKVGVYFSDRASFMMLEPDARVRSKMEQGTQRGTVMGEFMRFFWELKAFPFSVVDKTLGREIYGRGSDSLRDAIRNQNGEMVGFVNLMLWGTVFGYVSMSAKQLVRGKTVRDPLDPKTWAAAMLQGGAAGIYGDFLFGEVRSRYGGGVLTTAAGPTLGTVQDVADLYGRVVAGDDVASSAFRVLLQNTPYNNLFYTRMALDYLILWRIQETLNPGSLKRLESRIERENAQTFLIRPSEVVN